MVYRNDRLSKEFDYKELVEGISDTIYLTNTHGEFTYVSPAIKELLGYEPNELIGLLFPVIIHKDFVEKVTLHFIDQFKKKSPESIIDFIVVKKDGSFVWVEQTVKTIFNKINSDEIIGYRGVVRNIEKRKSLERDHLNNLSIFNEITNTLVDVFYLYDIINKEYIYISPNCIKILGVDQNYFYSGKSHTGKVVHPDDRVILKNANALIDSGESYDIEYRLIINDEIKWINEKSYPIFDENGMLNKNSGICIDITSLKKSQNIKDQFIDNINHELRTPLNAILGFSEFLLQENDISSDLSEKLKGISNSADELNRLIKSLLTLGDINNDNIKINLEKINIKDIYLNTVNLFEKPANDKKIKLELNSQTDLPEIVIADKAIFIRILTNLLDNALKFTFEGSISTNISIHNNNNLSYIRLEVEDSGIGISKENQGRIFKRFEQIDSGFLKTTRGAGIGLSECEELASLINGSITVQSEKGKGSLFSFEFPIKIVEEQKVKIQIENNTPHLLVVEDNELNILLMKNLLQKLDCSFDVAHNGKEAIDLYEDGVYDVILMDIQMPIMDGLEATKILKLNYKNVPPIIAVSANKMTDFNNVYKNAGLDDYLEKPYTMEDLNKKISYWIE